jgi:hypothetical protein
MKRVIYLMSYVLITNSLCVYVKSQKYYNNENKYVT